MMEEKIIVVDDEDNILSSETREIVDQKNLRYRISALWLTNPQGEILLARRAYSKSHDPGRWGPAAAGTVEEGETYDENMVKEAEEEIGLKDVEFKRGPKIRKEGKHRHFTQWYFAVIDKPAEEFNIQEEEVAEVRWFTKEEIQEQLKNKPDEFLKGIPGYLERFT